MAVFSIKMPQFYSSTKEHDVNLLIENMKSQRKIQLLNADKEVNLE
jgi:hypothetical protein